MPDQPRKTPPPPPPAARVPPAPPHFSAQPSGPDRLADGVNQAVAKTKQVYTNVKNSPTTQHAVATSKHAVVSLASKLAAKMNTPAGAPPPPPPASASGEAAVWYYSQGGSRIGPLPLSALHQMISAGQLPQSVYVWKKGMGDWQRADAIRGFFLLSGDPTRPG